MSHGMEHRIRNAQIFCIYWQDGVVQIVADMLTDDKIKQYIISQRQYKHESWVSLRCQQQQQALLRVQMSPVTIKCITTLPRITPVYSTPVSALMASAASPLHWNINTDWFFYTHFKLLVNKYGFSDLTKFKCRALRINPKFMKELVHNS